jgi:Domain of unknown function (DUF5060)/Cellulase (glycosyl hydrolase family 5)
MAANMKRYAVLAGIILAGSALPASAQYGRYPMAETVFHLKQVSGNPFDATENDVEVTFKEANGSSVTVPAFYDGGDTWKARYSPLYPGTLRATGITRNGQSVSLSASGAAPAQFTVGGKKNPGMVRINGLFRTQFQFESGVPYYPIGIDAAWRQSAEIDVPDVFRKMADSGMNWSRVWMCHWDGKNLEWPSAPEGIGHYNLAAARRWDSIIEAAERTGIHFQLTLQHHGQVSTTTDPNWLENPFNVRNGGFLNKPEEFFTSERARSLVKSKLHYCIARYGWSPAIMAWELFNEVEGTDAAHSRQFESIARWHKEMADYLRAHDPYHHLITTSSDMQMPGLYAAVDYYQPHSYSPDAPAAIEAIDPEALGKPAFFGEIGPPGNPKSDLLFLQKMLWASVMSDNSGAAEYWFWDRFTLQDLSKPFASVTHFIKSSGMEHQYKAKARSVAVKCAEPGQLAFGPGGNWATAKQTHFVIDAAGRVPGIGAMPAYFQGKSHRDMFPDLQFDVNCERDAKFTIVPGSISRGGALLRILVDGKELSSRNYPAGDPDKQILPPVSAPLAAGKHTIQVKNDGDDWINISRFIITPYGSALAARCKATSNFAMLWFTRSDETTTIRPVTGTVQLTGMEPGAYTIMWWNTTQGRLLQPVNQTVSQAGTLEVTTPPVSDSIACWIEKR